MILSALLLMTFVFASSIFLMTVIGPCVFSERDIGISLCSHAAPTPKGCCSVSNVLVAAP